MSVTYVGVSIFTLQKVEPRAVAADVPQNIETWRGKSADTTTFLAAHTIGLSYSGGYITDRSVREQGPWTEVDLVIAMPPDVSTAWASNSTSVKTVSMAETVTTDAVIENAATVNAERQITFYAPETRYIYFRLTQPSGPSYSSISNGAEPVIIRSVITASGATKTAEAIAADPPGEIGPDRTFVGGTAPAVLVAALNAVPGNVINTHESEIIPGTPWWRCTDVVTREYAPG